MKKLCEKRKIASEDELLKAMNHVMETINIDDCEGWYRNMKRYICVSLDGTEIND